ncbi:ABC transporter ATP-binding protein [Streptomonospora salina]|uniref:ATP-binding cassette subfamily B protein/ATP-binding cassette subfamily C protein n=1 Tax=Streptomonospora salina TaxID=104205 RepID=A0A841E2S2_9ACTN|nr:ABC transporter ATP-binding protein [Streptomonospora salina]MBB5998097.1 ATP-binding cassette subfamily B protein/ATP-binding cassette subfamily C protein [Streptomonospora salina]
MNRRRPRRPAPAAPAGLPELATSRFHPWFGDLQRLSLWHMLTRLPALIATALRWSWKASPRDTLLTVGLNIAAGAFSAVVLTAVVGILQGLFAQSPTPERLQAALPSLLLAGAATLTRAALRSAAIWAQGRLTPMVERAVEVELVSLTTATRLEAFDDSDWCDQIHRARTLGVYEAGRITGYAADIATELVSLLAVATVLTVLHPVLLPLLALTVAPVGWAAIRSARMRYARMRALSTSNRLLYMYTHAMTEREAAAELRAYAMRPMLLAEFARISDHVRDALLAVVGRQTTTRAVGDVLGGIATLATYAALVALLLAGLMPLAVAGAAYLALGQGKAALDRLMSAVNSCYESGLYLSDLLEAFDQARRRTPPATGTTSPGPLEELRVQGVDFAYPAAEANALTGVSITVERGRVVALVGENGSGKSTLATLISGLYVPDAGAITWNGTDIADLAPDELHARIGLIRQQYHQWPFSAERNITMAAPGDADPDRLGRALRLSGADQVVEDLAHGLDTPLDTRFKDGEDLSGGQRQRIAAARGLYPQADLVIADEPTAALDARAEERLFATFQAAAEGAAVLLITHRLASTRSADWIYVLDHGHVVEQGTHTDLITHGGLYAELYGIQAAAYNGVTPHRHTEEVP